MLINRYVYQFSGENLLKKNVSIFVSYLSIVLRVCNLIMYYKKEHNSSLLNIRNKNSPELTMSIILDLSCSKVIILI